MAYASTGVGDSFDARFDGCRMPCFDLPSLRKILMRPSAVGSQPIETFGGLGMVSFQSRILESNVGRLAMFAAMRLASSRVSRAPCNRLFQYHTVPCRNAEQLGDSPDQIRLEFMHDAVRHDHFPQHLNDAFAAVLVKLAA